VIRADIAIKREDDFNRALSDMNEAIKLQPHYAGFFVNRAFLRYKLDDYFGAMADYDYAIGLDPMSSVAYFNRGLLRAEVSDRDRAIADFTKVLSFDPDDYRSLFNRAILYEQNRDYRKAIADIDKVVEAFPDFDGAYFTRFRIYDEMGDKRNAEKDYNKALALSKAARAKKADDKNDGEVNDDASKSDAESTDESPDKLISQRFSTLLTIENSHDVDREFNNKSIRGRVQDRDVAVQIRPMFRLAYYVTTNQLKETPYYIKEVDDINATRSLRFVLQVTEDDSPIEDESAVARHFQSIEYYNSYIPTHQPRAIDYFGRAMDFMTIRNYGGAIEDFTKAIEVKPDFEMAYLMRAIARY
ncbi:MAG: tetratricopeptide repeat protein, partial [Muribaculaceae bacterium]|nr:tetratricopeptide repeat protein [Muribaculaceae bacterium]